MTHVASRWAVAGALAVITPFVTCAASPFVVQPVTIYLLFGLGWVVGLIGIHILPLPATARACIAFIYSPIMAYYWVIGVFVFACAFHGRCL